MSSLYETIEDTIIPVIRYETALTLRDRYHLKQQEIAKKLEITQAEVSKYLNNKSESMNRKIEELKDSIAANKELFAKYAKALVEGNSTNQLCTICQKLGNFKCRLVDLSSKM